MEKLENNLKTKKNTTNASSSLKDGTVSSEIQKNTEKISGELLQPPKRKNNNSKKKNKPKKIKKNIENNLPKNNSKKTSQDSSKKNNSKENSEDNSKKISSKSAANETSSEFNAILENAEKLIKNNSEKNVEINIEKTTENSPGKIEKNNSLKNDENKLRKNNLQKNNKNKSKKDNLKNVENQINNEPYKAIKSNEKSIKKSSNNSKDRIKKNNSEKNSTQIVSSKHKKINKKLIIISLFIFLLIILLFFSTIFALRASGSDKIISGISVNGIDLSGLTKTEAEKKLSTELSANLIDKIIVTRGDYSKTIDTHSLGAVYSIESSVDQAYSIGRNESNIFSNNFRIINTHINKLNINPNITYNSDLLIEKINEINNELPDRVVNSSYEIKDNSLIIANSTNGYRIQNEKFKDQIQSALSNKTATFEIPVEEYEADEVNIDAIYEKIHKEPKDASFKTNPYEIIKEEEGLDFAISLEDARKLVSQEQELYTIPLKKLTPKVTVKTLPLEAFPDKLATYSTTYASSNYNRSTNISLASKSINGYVLMPGESFSYNTIVGQRTPARGYKEAGVYVNGEVSTDYGGGICQVSSTLYNSVLLTNLEIVQRTNHTFEPSYVPAGQDATVSWKSPDFIFKNNRNYPIKIVASAGGGKIQVDIIGLKTNDDYVVKIQSSKTGTIPFSTEYKDDNSLPAGTTKVIQYGSNGCKSQTYKVLYKDGNEVSRTLLSSDTYKPHNQVIVRGTKVEPAPQPSQPAETQTPEPSNSPTENGSGVTITTDISQ